MSFRNRFFASTTSAGGAAGSAAGESSNHSSAFHTAGLNSSFSARESRRSLTKEEFQKSTRQLSTASATIATSTNINGRDQPEIDEEAEKHLGFAFSRTKRQGYDDIALMFRTSGDSAEDAMSSLCGISALSDADLIRLTEIDGSVWKTLLAHETNSVRCAAITVGSQVANRIWSWFSLSQVFDSIEDYESCEQDVRNWVVQLWRAIADKYVDDDDAVSARCYDALHHMATPMRHVLFERVARHLLPLTAQVVARAMLVRTTAATRFATKLLLFAIEEVRPHTIAPSGSGVSISSASLCASIQSFIDFHLVPLMDGSEALNGDVCLAGAEEAIRLVGRFYRFSTYEAGRIMIACANAALLQLRALDANGLVLPDSTRHSRRKRCAKLLFATARDPTHLRHRQRVRVLGRCTAICATYSTMKSLLKNCCSAIISAELSQPQESAIQALLVSDQGILRTVWKGADKPRHRLAYFLLSDVIEAFGTGSSSLLMDLSLRILEACSDCLAWTDSSFQNHAAGQAYVELLSRVVAESTSSSTGSMDHPQLERLIRNTIEWRLESPTNTVVKARLLWVCEKAICQFSGDNLTLGHKLIDASSRLAMAHLFSHSSTDVDDLLFANISGGGAGGEKRTSPSLFVACIGILSHLAKQVPALRNAVAASYGLISTRSRELSRYEKWFLEDRTREMERPRSMTVTSASSNHRLSPMRRHSSAKLSSSSRRVEASAEIDSRCGSTLNEGEEDDIQNMVYECQLSGGNDPLYVIGSVRRDGSKAPVDNGIVCLLRVFNVSGANIGPVVLRVACRGDVHFESGQDNAHCFKQTLQPGCVAQWKFSLERTGDWRSTFSQRRGVDVTLSYADALYDLTTWWFPIGIFLQPKTVDPKAFRFAWGRKTGSSSKCEAHIITGSSESLGKLLFEDATEGSPFYLVARSERMAMFSAVVLGSDEAVLLTCQVAGGNRLALDLRSSEKGLLNGFDLREAFSEVLFPGIANFGLSYRIVWSGKGSWAGSRTDRADLEDNEELEVPGSLWALNCSDNVGVAGSDLTNQGHAMFNDALTRWKVIKKLRDSA